MIVRQATRGLSRSIGADLSPVAGSARGGAMARHLLDRYLEGWADVNPGKIIAATTQDYRFYDPLVGRFSSWTIRSYLERVRARFLRVGPMTAKDLAIFIRGPMEQSAQGEALTFFREAPRLGLTGVTVIAFGQSGVIAETVAYDLNLASELLRGPA